MMNNTPYQQTGSLQISFPHWLWTSPLLFTFVRLRLPRHEQFSSMSIPKSNSEIVTLPVLNTVLNTIYSQKQKVIHRNLCIIHKSRG